MSTVITSGSAAAQTPWAFIARMALFMSLIAFSIDAMIPALDRIAQDYGLSNTNDVQFVISSIFAGMAVGMLFVGPLSDAYGRKPALYIGLLFYILGSGVCVFSSSFEMLIIGRLLQGFGGAALRVITITMVRDQFAGVFMARVMSFVMIIFILVPAIAPSIGQALLLFWGWHGIFVSIFSAGVFCLLLLFFFQKETLVAEKRLAFSLATVVAGVKECALNDAARTYTLAAAMVFSALIAYLSTSQQILQIDYQLGAWFALVFGGLALALGIAAVVNAQLVMRVGMGKLSIIALAILVFITLVALPVNYLYAGKPPLVALLMYLFIVFFCFGILFANLNALAMQPLGHIAGVASSAIAFTQSTISVVCGATLSYFHNNTVTPILLGYFGLFSLSLLLVWRAQRRNNRA